MQGKTKLALWSQTLELVDAIKLTEQRRQKLEASKTKSDLLALQTAITKAEQLAYYYDKKIRQEIADLAEEERRRENELNMEIQRFAIEGNDDVQLHFG